MKHLFLNLKRFDISPARGGVNRLAPMADWGGTIVRAVQERLGMWPEAEYVVFLPEAHILGAAAVRTPHSPLLLGCQGVFRDDTAVGGPFGAFTTNLTANAARELGCQSTLIGHCEERADMAGILSEGGVTGEAASRAVCGLLNREIVKAQAAGLSVVYCVGEKSEEQDRWRETLSMQLDVGLRGVDASRVVIAYEPIWSIGPGKTPAGKDYIRMIADFIKEHTGGLDVIYGGGLKQDNARMLASIPEIDGGLIALTRFTGEIGFYPEEYLDIIRRYLGR